MWVSLIQSNTKLQMPSVKKKKNPIPNILNLFPIILKIFVFAIFHMW